MTTPQTSVDPRFSQAGAVATSWADTLAAIEEAQLFWVTTVRADGRPHVTPLVAVWSQDALAFCTGDAEQKAVNLTQNASVVLTTGCNGWEGGLDVMVEGQAVAVTDPADLQRLAGAWTAKWDGSWDYEVGQGCFHHPGSTERVLVYAVAPTKVLAFAKGDFAHTRHVFTGD